MIRRPRVFCSIGLSYEVRLRGAKKKTSADTAFLHATQKNSVFAVLFLATLVRNKEIRLFRRLARVVRASISCV